MRWNFYIDHRRKIVKFCYYFGTYIWHKSISSTRWRINHGLQIKEACNFVWSTIDVRTKTSKRIFSHFWNSSKFLSNQTHIIPARAGCYLQLLTLSMKRSSTWRTGTIGPNEFAPQASENVNESAVVVSTEPIASGRSRGYSPAKGSASLSHLASRRDTILYSSDLVSGIPRYLSV